ncbi:MAG: hypothetical protein ACLRRT_11015 [Ruthenibacterium lactatiformans]
MLDRGGWFNHGRLRRRPAARRDVPANLQRAAARQSFGNYEDYLRSLEMR